MGCGGRHCRSELGGPSLDPCNLQALLTALWKVGTIHTSLFYPSGPRCGLQHRVQVVPPVRQGLPDAGDLLRPDGSPPEEAPLEEAAGFNHWKDPGAKGTV